MTKRRLEVDMGSMHLPVGEDNLPGGETPAARSADPLAVGRFRDALDGHRRPPPQWPAEEEIESPFALFGAPDPSRPAPPSEIAAAVEGMWVNQGVSGVREVRAKLGARLCRETSVRLYEAAGCLNVDLSSPVESSAQWLVSVLPALAKDVGQRLQRAVRIAVFGPRAGDGRMDEIEAIALDWPQDGTP